MSEASAVSGGSRNTFGAKGTLEAGGASHEIYRLAAVEGSEALPYSLKILLENLLRTEDGANITADHIRALAGWEPTPSRARRSSSPPRG